MKNWDRRAWWAIGIFTAVIVFDQWVKLYIKTHFYYGEAIVVIPQWLNIQFVENPGMAFGWMLPGQSGKLLLTSFRIVVFVGITWYLIRLIKERASVAFISCMSLILAGALGNIFDSVFYGIMFDKGSVYDAQYEDYVPYADMAHFNGEGYAPALMGNVVDMIHVTKWIHFPEWFPFLGGEMRPLFPPIFNIADAAISVGIVFLLLFQKRFFKQQEEVVTVIESTDEMDVAS